MTLIVYNDVQRKQLPQQQRCLKLEANICMENNDVTSTVAKLFDIRGKYNKKLKNGREKHKSTRNL